MAVMSTIVTLVTLTISVLIIAGITTLIINSVYPTKDLKPSEQAHRERTVDDILKHIYLYLILFVTLMMSIGGSIGIFMGAANYIAPNYYVETYDQYKTNQCGNNPIIPYDAEDTDTKEREPEFSILPYPYPGDEQCLESELRDAYDRMVNDAKEDARDQALRTMVQSLGWIIIPLPIFFYFQRQLNRSKQSPVTRDDE